MPKRNKSKKKIERDADEARLDEWKPGRRLPSFSIIDFLGNSWDFVVSWRDTRRWSKVAIVLPVALLSVFMFACVAIGKSSSSRTKLNWYLEKADEQVLLTESEAKDNSTASNSSDDSTSDDKVEKLKSLQEKNSYADFLFKRVLQLESNNKRARYYVASQMARYGKLGPATATMQELAPADQAGLDLAHAWLATSLINQSQRGQSIDLGLLKHHLKHSSNRQDLAPGLLLVYSQLLQQENNFEEAIAMLKRAANADIRLQLNAASIFMQRGMIGQAKAAADTLIEAYTKKFDKDPDDEFRIAVAQALGATQRMDQAIVVLQEGVRIKPTSPRLRRALSDSLRFRFRTSIVRQEQRVSLGLDYLNMAIVADPTNISIQDDLNLITSLGLGATQEGADALKNQIALGGTSYVARLLLAEVAIRADDLNTAITHYELILNELPDMLLAINNLAMIAAKNDPSKVNQSIEMIDRAIAINPNFSEFYDTRGEIYLLADRKEDALADFRMSTLKNPNNTRGYEKTIRLLKELGRENEAVSEEATLTKVRELLAQQTAEQAIQQAAQQSAQQSDPQSASQAKPSPQ